MNINSIIEVHKKYKTTSEDIIKRHDYAQILENVVVAPWWSHSIFESFSDRIEKVGEKVYNIFGKNFQFSYIEIKNIGAPVMIDTVLPLALTPCKRIIFIGSVGALNKNIQIGDLIIPQYSYNGVGACRFLSEDLKDDFETKAYGDLELNEKILAVIRSNFPQNAVHQTINYSIDTIFTQFYHIEHIKNLGCESIEMETSSLFKCGELANIRTSALLCVSDNIVKNKSLYSGRNEEERKIKKETINKIIPQIIIKVLQEM